MTAKKLGLLIVLLIVHLISYAQKPSGTIRQFVKYLNTTRDLSDDITKDCKWYYALVKVTCDRNNKVVRHQVLNEVPEHIKAYFKGIEGFRIKDKRSLLHRPIYICAAFENMATDCILADKTIAAEGAIEIYALVAKELKKYPKAILSEDLVGYGYDIKGDTIKCKF